MLERRAEPEVVENFNWDSVTDRFCEVYERLTGEPQTVSLPEREAA